MLSVDDIKNIKFRRASFGGYKPEDVDDFIDEVQVCYEKLLKERYSLYKEIDSLNAKIKKYHEEEGCIRDAILAAQKLADSSVKEAKGRAEKILSDAQNYANKIYEDANCKMEKSTNDYTQLKKESNEFRSQLLELYKKHIELINEIPINEEEQVELSIEEGSDEASLNELESKSIVDKGIRKKFLVLDKDKEEETENKDIFTASKVPVRKYENLKFGANYDIKSDINVQ